MNLPRGRVATGDWHAAIAAAPPGLLLLHASWARVEPERGAYHDEELWSWREALREGRKRGIEAIVVMHNGALPDWQIARGGWMDPDALSTWGCYADRLTRDLGEVTSRWAVFRSILDEAAWYGNDARAAGRAMIDAHASAWLTLHRSPAYGGRPAEVGMIERWGVWSGSGVRGAAMAAKQRHLGPDVLLSIFSTGRLAPPFAPFGELPNGTPALDWVGMEWRGAVRYPEDVSTPGEPEACAATIRRLGEGGRGVLTIDAPEGACAAAVASGVRVIGALTLR